MKKILKKLIFTLLIFFTTYSNLYSNEEKIKIGILVPLTGENKNLGQLIIKATKVNGIYNKDPVKNKNAKLIKNITYNEVINKNLQVMDLTAISLAKDTKIPIFITNIFNKNSLINVLNRKGSYSKIS